jgi:ABC-type Fe3+-hydroxamate transport system substrate-binding protein
MNRQYIDMTGREVNIPFPPRRIISLVPSQTELLFDLGLDEEVVGITKFCVHPEEWFRNKKRVGGTKTVHLDIVRNLQPYLIIANKEENTREQVEELALQFPVWVSDITTIDHGLDMIRKIGIITGKEANADQLAKEIHEGFKDISSISKPLKVAYYIWKDPWMTVGGDTFISDVITRIGWKNVVAEKSRYPEVAPSELTGTGVALILLSSEPYPFKEKHIAKIQSLHPNAQIMLVDGEMFSWYGSRMKEAIPYLRELISTV